MSAVPELRLVPAEVAATAELHDDQGLPFPANGRHELTCALCGDTTQRQEWSLCWCGLMICQECTATDLAFQLGLCREVL